MTIVNFTENNESYKCLMSIGDGTFTTEVRSINLDQLLWDLDKQILILKDHLYSVEYSSSEEGLLVPNLYGQLSALEMIRSQFDGF